MRESPYVAAGSPTPMEINNVSATPDPFDLTDVPDVAAYKRAFVECREGMSDLHLAMLEAHHRAPGHTVTAGQLANAVGLPSFSAANLHYGTFAGRLCMALGREPEIQVAILVTFGGGDGEEITWTMLPQVVEALEQIRWVRPTERGTA